MIFESSMPPLPRPGAMERPTVILAKTKKGYGMGRAGESRMTAHQEKKLDIKALLDFRDRFHLPLSDEAVSRLDFYKPTEDSREMRYLRERREALGGSLPARRSAASALEIPPLDSYASFALQAQERDVYDHDTVRLIGALLRDKTLGDRIVPIVADEARTFGMASLFRQLGIYSPHGQLYEPEDASSLLAYEKPETDNCSKKASPKPVLYLRGLPLQPRTACTDCRFCRSIFITLCSAFSASET